MTEPVSSGATGMLIYKLGAWGLAAALAAVVVMSMMPPRTAREMLVSLICTVISSLGAGSAVIQYFGLLHMMETPIGLLSILGLVFACGLPGWFLVRAWFVYVERNEKRDLHQILQDFHRD